MALHPVLEEKFNTALAPGPAEPMTRRDAALPEIPGKVHAVTGMRRAGKTTFLRQLVAERRRGAAPECALYLSFDDDRLVDIAADQLSALLEEFCRRHPQLRRRELLQVCADPSTADAREREMRALADAAKTQSKLPAALLVLTQDRSCMPACRTQAGKCWQRVSVSG